jgi:hypothetical protein
MADKEIRSRSGAYRFDLAYRLVNMYSLKGDTVVDPFLGTGTTMAAAMAAGRNSIGFEIESGFQDEILSIQDSIVETANDRISRRIKNHLEFVQRRSEEKGQLKYLNTPYKFPVMTRQEMDLFFNPLEHIDQIDNASMEVTYSDAPGENFAGDWQDLIPPSSKKAKANQLKLF